MPKNKSENRGGKRTGAGRPGIEGGQIINLTLTVGQRRKLETIRERLDLESLGHVLRYLIDSANLITDKERG